MTQKQIRGEYVTAVEEKLKRHPLVIYPHYKDHMTPEVRQDKLFCARTMRAVWQAESRQMT